MKSLFFNFASASCFMLLVFWGSCDNASTSTNPGKSDAGYTTPPQTDEQMNHDQNATGSSDTDTNKINTVTGKDPK